MAITILKFYKKKFNKKIAKIYFVVSVMFNSKILKKSGATYENKTFAYLQDYIVLYTIIRFAFISIRSKN